MKPLNNNVIIKPIKKEGTIILTDDKKPLIGIVQSLGINVKEGDKVAFKQYTSTEIDDVIVIDEKDILFIYD